MPRPPRRGGNGGQDSNTQPGAPMREVCAWCNRLLSDDIDAPVSHGICENCRIEAEFHHERLDDFLNRLGGPVLAVDGEGQLVGSNDIAAVFVSSDVASMKGHLAGEVLSCVYSELPGGCGRTTHCTGCAIRQAFEYTASSGEPVHNRPAFSYTRTPRGRVWKCFEISTERLGQLVLVRIEGGDEDTSGRVWH